MKSDAAPSKAAPGHRRRTRTGTRSSAPRRVTAPSTAATMTDLDLTTRIEASYRNARIEALAGVSLALALAACVASSVPVTHVAGFAAAAVVVYGLRVALARTYLGASGAPSARWTKIYSGGAGIAGAVWGAGGWLFVGEPALLPTGMTLYFLGIAIVGGMLVYAASFTAVVAFVLAATLPTAARLASAPETELKIAAVMVLALGALAAAVGRLVSRHRLAALAHEGNIRHLASLLDQRRDQVEKLNVAVKTNADKRQQAEIELRKISADLGLVQGKAKALSETLARVSTVCHVTELHNRKRFEEIVLTEWRRNLREKRPVSLLVVSIDDYEDYLTGHGRQGTDALLKRLAKVVRAFGRRAGDEAGRYAEERLALLLPHADTRNAARIGEAIRRRIEAQAIPHGAGDGRTHVTVHVAVATMIPVATLDGREIFKRAETALYEAQFRGGNRVVVYQALERLRLERWNQKSDGELNEQAMLQKMLVWGLEPTKRIYDGGADVLDEDTLNDEAVFGVLGGLLKLVIEGHEVHLKPGDALFVPAGVTCSAVVESETPLMALTASRPPGTDDAPDA